MATALKNLEVAGKEHQQQTQQTKNKEGVFENKPIVETRLSMSKDRKYVIHKTVITDIKPRRYWEKVCGNK